MGKPVQTYQRKCFRVVLLWNLENFNETDSDRDTPPGVVYCWSSADIIRRVWGIGRIHVSKVVPEPQSSGCETAPHFCVLNIFRRGPGDLETQ